MQMQRGAGKAGTAALPSHSHLEFAMLRLLAPAGKGGGFVGLGGRGSESVGQGGEGRQIPCGSLGRIPGGGDGSERG